MCLTQNFDEPLGAMELEKWGQMSQNQSSNFRLFRFKKPGFTGFREKSLRGFKDVTPSGASVTESGIENRIGFGLLGAEKSPKKLLETFGIFRC